MATAQTISQTSAPARAAPEATTIAAALMVGLLGLSLVWFSGFANAAELHNAAHDSRHSLVFPCH